MWEGKSEDFLEEEKSFSNISLSSVDVHLRLRPSRQNCVCCDTIAFSFFYALLLRHDGTQCFNKYLALFATHFTASTDTHQNENKRTSLITMLQQNHSFIAHILPFFLRIYSAEYARSYSPMSIVYSVT